MLMEQQLMSLIVSKTLKSLQLCNFCVESASEHDILLDLAHN